MNNPLRANTKGVAVLLGMLALLATVHEAGVGTSSSAIDALPNAKRKLRP